MVRHAPFQHICFGRQGFRGDPVSLMTSHQVAHALQISPGGQGFRSDLLTSTWYNNGVTGEDYVGLMKIPEISFGTVHFCELPTINHGMSSWFPYSTLACMAEPLTI